MKVSLTAVLLLCASTLTTTVQAGWDDNDPQRFLAKGGNGNGNANGNGNGNGNNNNDDEEEEVGLFVKYRNSNGKSDVEKLAKNGKVKDIPRFKIASFKTARKNKNAIKKNPNIEYVEEEQIMTVLPHVRGGAEDEAAAQESLTEEEHRRLAEEVPYGITMVQAGPNGLSQGSTPIKVCVVDTGYGMGHPDLPTDTLHGVDGTNTESGTWNFDGHSHGTHCAGTIGAIGGNGVGVTSVNPDPSKFQFHIGKGLSDSGSGTSSAVLDAVAGCANAGAKIISMSLGGGGFSQTTNNIYRDLYDDGILVIAAAGNGGNSAFSYPASYPYVMSVAAVDSNQNKAGFSQYNSQVEIAGPGVSVKSTITGNAGSTFGYASYSGTSMATPHVAGVAALVWSHFPQCTGHQIRNTLINSAIDRGANGCDPQYGYGIVQAQAAYDLLTAQGCEGAGGVNPEPLSSGSLGGCLQDPNYTPPPTLAPTPFVCDQTTVTVELTTDNYGGETSWELTDSSGTVHASGSNYANTNTYVENFCVPADACTFTIYDTWGDGICCSYGSGSYSVYRNGALAKQGGAFGSSETTEICSAVPDPTPAPVAPAPVTPAPITPAPITPAPVTPAPITPAPATPAPVTPAPVTPAPVTPAPITPAPVTPAPVAPTPCNGMEFDLTLNLDNYPGETTWELSHGTDGTVIETGGPYSGQVGGTVTISSCVPDDCYRFTIRDSWGDGVCCGHGQGSYTLNVDGAQLHNGGDFNNAEITLFGTCAYTGIASTEDKPGKS